MIICSATNKSLHCKTCCLHGIPHLPSIERDGNCKKSEFCNLSDSKSTVKVHCRPLTAKEIKKYKKENNES